MTEYITVKDGIVTGHFASKSDTVPEDGIVVENFLPLQAFIMKMTTWKKMAILY